MYFTIPSLIEQINIFVGNVPELLNLITDFVGGLGLSFDTEKFSNYINDSFVNITKNFIVFLNSSFNIFFNVALGVSGAIFLSFDFPKFRNAIKKYIPNKIKRPVVYYFHNLLPFVHKYFRGMLLDSIFIFIISIISTIIPMIFLKRVKPITIIKAKE